MAEATISPVVWMEAGGDPASHASSEGCRALIVEAKAGDLGAFERLVIMHEQRVFRTARAILGNEADAADGAQEVWIRFHKHLGRFDPDRELMPWLYRMTVNVCRDLAKRRKRDSVVSAQAAIAAGTPGPLESLTQREQLELTRRALARLPHKERAAITLRDIEGLGTRETALALGTSEATVRSQLSSGRKKLRRFVAEADGSAR